MSMIRVLIADDHKLVRDGYRAMLERTKDIQVVGEARDGIEAVEMTAQLQPDVVTMDIQMPRMDGLKATRKITEGGGCTRVLMVSMTWDPAIMEQSKKVGARGFVSKSEGILEFEAAVRAVANGQTYYGTVIQKALKNGGL